MSSSTSGATASVEATLDPRLLRIAAVVILGTLMSILDTTIVNVAIKDLSRSFNAPLSTMQWIATGYMLALATVIPLTGWAADRFGTKRLYIGSIGMFLLGSALSGAAWSAGSLIVFRVLQGIGGGMIMPAGMTILTHAAGPQRMGRVMGIVGVPMLLGPIIGPILGGWLVDDVSWRWIFFVNLPIGAIALYAAARILERDEPTPHHALDWRGLLMLSPGLAIFVYGLAETAAGAGLDTVGGGGAIALGLALVIGFVLHARARDGALIDVRLFAQRAVGAPALTVFLFCTAFFGVALLMPLYFQVVRGKSAFDAGMLLAAQGVGAMLSMPIAARLTDRIGAGRIVLVGLSLVALGMLSLSRITGDTALWQVELTLFVMGLGMGSTMMPTMSAALSATERGNVARVTAGLNVLQRVGGSIGTAVLAVVLSHQLAAVMPIGGGGGLSAVHAIPASVHGQMLPALGAAFGHTFMWSFGLVLAALAAALFIHRGRSDAAAGQAADKAPAIVD
ncbi:MAG: DHA2 family efflux MFS transporter permease subunit [Rhodanobacter sp.]